MMRELHNIRWTRLVESTAIRHDQDPRNILEIHMRLGLKQVIAVEVTRSLSQSLRYLLTIIHA